MFGRKKSKACSNATNETTSSKAQTSSSTKACGGKKSGSAKACK